MKRLEFDVTGLIDAVKKEHKLFYPVMMYILLSSFGAKEDYVFYQTDEDRFLKTMWHPDFETFYKNYIFDCYQEQRQENIPEDKLFVALYRDKTGRADFLLYPFEEKDGKTYLPIEVKRPISKAFVETCQKACLHFLV